MFRSLHKAPKLYSNSKPQTWAKMKYLLQKYELVKDVQENPVLFYIFSCDNGFIRISKVASLLIIHANMKIYNIFLQ